MADVPATSSTATTTSGPDGRRALPIVLGLAAVVVAAVVLYVATRDPAKAAPNAPTMRVEGEAVTIAPDAPQWQYLQISAAEEGPPLQPLPVPGRVDFDENRSASVGSPLEGRVEKVLVRFGDRVKKGQHLFSVRSAAFADLDRELASAREAVTVKKRMLERTIELVKLQAAPEKERLSAEAELKEAELGLKAAQAKQSSLSVSAEGDNLFYVTAPRDGTVVEHDVFGSQEVGPSREKPLVRISDLDEVLVIGDVAERDAADLRPGTTADVHTGTAARQGVVERVSEVVDPRRHTVEIRIRVQNLDRALRPNAFVEVAPGIDATARFVRVPTEAVVTEGEESVVFVQSATGALVRTVVRPGRSREGIVEVRAGLTPGQKYVSKGALLLLNQVDLAK